eukprot:s80_g14.t1
MVPEATSVASYFAHGAVRAPVSLLVSHGRSRGRNEDPMHRVWQRERMPSQERGTPNTCISIKCNATRTDSRPLHGSFTVQKRQTLKGLAKMGKKKQAAKPTSIYDSLTTINFEELAEQEEWETMSQLERKMTEARVAFEEQKVQERAARREARHAREKKIRAKKKGGENISGPFRRPCGVPQELGCFQRLPVQYLEPKHAAMMDRPDRCRWYSKENHPAFLTAGQAKDWGWVKIDDIQSVFIIDLEMNMQNYQQFHVKEGTKVLTHTRITLVSINLKTIGTRDLPWFKDFKHAIPIFDHSQHVTFAQRHRGQRAMPDGLKPFVDHYAVLECSPSNTPEQLKKAYHEKLRQFHPDKRPWSAGDYGQQVTQSLNEAWEALRFPALREAYDVIWHREKTPAAPAPAPPQPPAPPAREAREPQPRGRSRRRHDESDAPNNEATPEAPDTEAMQRKADELKGEGNQLYRNAQAAMATVRSSEATDSLELRMTAMQQTGTQRCWGPSHIARKPSGS